MIEADPDLLPNHPFEVAGFDGSLPESAGKNAVSKRTSKRSHAVGGIVAFQASCRRLRALQVGHVGTGRNLDRLSWFHSGEFDHRRDRIAFAWSFGSLVTFS